MPKIGKPAPDFTLQTQTDQPITLSDLRGGLVVIFTFPQVDSEVTNKHLRGMCDLHADIVARGGVMFGIGVESVQNFAQVHTALDLPYDLLSDPDHAVLAQYDAWDSTSFKARSFASPLRSFWVIDADGVVIAGQTRVTVQMCLDGVRSTLDL